MAENEIPFWKRDEILIGALVVCVLALGALAFVQWQQMEHLKVLGPEGKPATAGALVSTTSSGPKPTLELFVMAQCPYGTQAEAEVFKALQTLGDSVDFKLRFLVSPSANGFSSLHGANELAEDQHQVCVQKHAPDKLADYVTCVDKNYQNVATVWGGCASQLGLTQTINSCVASGEANQLLTADVAAAQAYGFSGSPSFAVAGKAFSGGRDSLAITRAMCNAGATSTACAGLPACGTDEDCATAVGDNQFPHCLNAGQQNAKCEGVAASPVQLVVLNSANCTSCDDSQIVDALKGILKNVNVTRVDVTSDEGKQLLAETQAKYLPTYLLGQEATSNYGWQARADLQGAFEQKGKWLKLLDDVSGATYFASEEGRQQFLAQTGINVSDGRPDIDFFTMAYCPYGNQAEEAIAPVYDKLNGSADFKPHFVVYQNYQGGSATYCIENGKYCSMHGVQELHEDVRELCASEHFGVGAYFTLAKAMNAKCTASNADSCWEAVAKDAGLDVDAIKTCAQNEQDTLLAEQVNLDKLFGASGSPAVYLNGASYSGARTAAGFASGLCALMDTKPAACSEQYAAPAAGSSAAPATGGCGG